MSEAYCEAHDQPESWCAAGYASASASPGEACPAMTRVSPEFRAMTAQFMKRHDEALRRLSEGERSE